MKPLNLFLKNMERADYLRLKLGTEKMVGEEDSLDDAPDLREDETSETSDEADKEM